MKFEISGLDSKTVNGQKNGGRRFKARVRERRSKKTRIAFIVIAAISIVNAENLTIHLLNPWAKDTALVDSLYIISNEPGWWPGKTMSKESCNWYSYTFQSTPRTDNSQRIEFMWGNPSGNHLNYTKGITGTGQLFMSQIFGTQPTTVTDVWMTIPDTTKAPVLSFSPPPGKNVHFLQPWDFGASMMQAQGGRFVRMQMDTGSNRCGWFSYPYYCGYDSAHVKFMNSIDSSYFSVSGLGNGAFIDLSVIFKTSDTAWIIADPVTGRAAVSPKFPGQTAACERELNLATTLRNYDSTHPDFGGFVGGGKNGTKTGCWHQGDWWGIISGMMLPQLVAGKLVQSPTNPCPIDRFDWFTTLPLKGGYTNEFCYNLKLVKNSDGYYEYDNSHFFVADSFRWLDPNHTVANPWYTQIAGDDGLLHNQYFTLELSAHFQYQKGQTFYFRGDDDVWVYINNKLAVDIGGIHQPMEGSVKLDTLGLTVGSLDSLRLFYCSRNPPGSSFRIVTSIKLQTSDALFYTKTSPGGAQRYDMYLKIYKNGLACGEGTTVIDTQRAIMDFYLNGPQFPVDSLLANGLHFGGITIMGDSSVVLDTTKLSGLMPGNYTIRSYLRSDHSQLRIIPFVIHALPADHLDLLVDSIKLDRMKDAKVDSIVIGMLDSAAGAYAVLRDVNQAFLGYATNPVWTVRDPTVVTVTRSATDSSRCILTRVNAGKTWLVLTQGGLKPDSVLVITYVLPKYPVVASATMLDTNADLVPDQLSITLTDTFKTGQHLDSVIVTYRNQKFTIPAASTTMRGTTLLVPFTAPGIDGRPTGMAAIALTDGTDKDSSSHAFTDGVCPALIAADVLENDGTQPDVLFLTFSEPVSAGSVSGKQLLLIQANTADTVAMNIMQVLKQSNDSTFTVQISPADPKALAGDRLRLVPGSRGGQLQDISKNNPHDNNRSVVIGFRPGAAAILAAWYRDANADGIVDEIVLRFKRHVLPAELAPVVAGWGSHQYIADPANARQVDDSTLAIPLSGVMEISTGGSMDLLVGYTAVPDVHRIFSAADSAAPVLVSARLVAGAIVSGGNQGRDSLIVRFSESVRDPGTRPFWLSSRAGGVRYQSLLGPRLVTNEWCRSTVGSIVPAGAAGTVRGGDTVWIDTAARVTDSSGVVQLNPQNRRVLLEVTWPKQTWQMSLSSNPFTPLVTPIPPEYSAGGMAYGTVIILRPTSPIDLEHTRGTIVIYDPLGNTVTNAPLQSMGGRYCFPWSGVNRQGRLVGTGAYLGVVRVFDNDRAAYSNKIKIGVKR